MYDEVTGRYSLLETVRQYAQQNSLDAGDSQSARAQHLAYFVEFLADIRTHLRGPEQLQWLARIDAEYDNIRVALEWGLSENGNWLRALDIAKNLVDYWMIRGLLIEATTWVSQLESRRTDWSPASSATLLVTGGLLRAYRGTVDLAKSEEAVTLARESGDDSLLGLTLSALTGDYISQSRIADAERTAQEAVGLFEKTGDSISESRIWIQLGNVAFTGGDLDKAEHHYQKCLDLRIRMKDFRGVGSVLGSLGDVYERRGDAEAAHKHLRMAIGAFIAVRSLWDLAGGLPSLCAELLHTGRPKEAAEILGCADALLAELGAARDSADTDIYERWVRDVRAKLGSDEFMAAYTAGYGTPLDDLIAKSFPNGLDLPKMETQAPLVNPSLLD